jgi:uncharacterized membrane protein
MSPKERIIHAILFELIALALIVPIATMITDKDSSAMLLVSVALSIYTVIWNYFYNIWFDRMYGNDRASRSLVMRIGHAVGFEGGLIFVTVPVVSWFLDMSLLSALLLETTILVFAFIYAIAFNWCYDNMRCRFRRALKL